MIEILQFVFSSFWIWLGSLILLAVAGNVVIALVGMLLALLVGRRS